MKKYLQYIIAAVAMTWLSACVKDELHDTTHPTEGGLTVVTLWPSENGNQEIPSPYTLMIGNATQEVTGVTNHFGSLLNPGNHTLTIYNVPEGMTLEGTVISVDKTIGSNILATPGNLFYAKQSFDIMADTELTLEVEMEQITRRLEIVLTVADSNINNILDAIGTLGGVCPSFDIATGERSVTVSQTTSEIVRDGDKLHLNYNLLGLTPEEEQTLTIEITYPNGDTEVIESDITELLEDEEEKTSAPITITGELSISAGSLHAGSISGWGIAEGGNFNAN